MPLRARPFGLVSVAILILASVAPIAPAQAGRIYRVRQNLNAAYSHYDVTAVQISITNISPINQTITIKGGLKAMGPSSLNEYDDLGLSNGVLMSGLMITGGIDYTVTVAQTTRTPLPLGTASVIDYDTSKFPGYYKGCKICQAYPSSQTAAKNASSGNPWDPLPPPAPGAGNKVNRYPLGGGVGTTIDPTKDFTVVLAPNGSIRMDSERYGSGAYTIAEVDLKITEDRGAVLASGTSAFRAYDACGCHEAALNTGATHFPINGGRPF